MVLQIDLTLQDSISDHHHSSSRSSSPLTSLSSSSEHSPLPIIRLPIPKIHIKLTSSSNQTSKMSSSSTPTSRPSFTTYPTYPSPSTTPIPSSSPRYETLTRAVRPDPQRHGHIPNVLPGAVWPNRIAISQAGVHAPIQAGISGHENRGGAESVVLNGGYPYGDSGDIIWYMGAGGMTNPETNKKTSIMQTDQTLDGVGNKAMVKSLRSRLPVRVIRGPHASDSPWAPLEGYRYDGLYRVTNQINTVDPSHQTDYICYVWRMERIHDPDVPHYKIPIRSGQNSIAKERARLGILKKEQEDQENLAKSLRETDQSSKRSSGFSYPGTSKRYKREDPTTNHKRQDSSSTLPTAKPRYSCPERVPQSTQSRTQPISSTSNHRTNVSSTQQAKRPIAKEHHKAQIPNIAFGWNGMDGAQVGNVLKSISFRKKPTIVEPNQSQSQLDGVVLPNIAKSSINTSSSPQTNTLDRPTSNINTSSHLQTNPTNSDRTTSTSTPYKPADPLPQPHCSRESDDGSDISDQLTFTNDNTIQDLMDTLAKSKSLIEEEDDEETEAELVQSRLTHRNVADQNVVNNQPEAALDQTLSSDQLEAEQSRSTDEIDMDTVMSSSTQVGDIIVNREKTPGSSQSQLEEDLLSSPPRPKRNLTLASPICLTSSSIALSPPALNSPLRSEFHEEDKSSSRRSSPIGDDSDSDDDDDYYEDPQMLRDIKMMMEDDDDDDEEEDQALKGSLQPDKNKTPLFRDPPLMEGEEGEIIPEISTDETTDPFIRPLQADQPPDIVLGVTMKRIKDPADGCMVVYDPSKGKYMVGDFEIEDSDDEMEATQTRIEVKEEDEDANLLDLIDD